MAVSKTTVQPIDSWYFVVNTLPFLIGYLLNWVLFGVLSVQVYLYYLAFPKDKRLSKTLVFGVYALETVQTILLSQDAFTLYTLANVVGVIADTSPERPLYRAVPVSLTKYAVPVIGGIVAFVVQVFYAYRLLILTKSKIILVFIIMGSILQFLGATLGGVPQFANIPFYDFFAPSLEGEDRTAIFVLVWGVGSAFVDIAIAVLMMYHLIRRDSGWKSTHTLLVKLVGRAVETGLVTAMVAIIYVLFLFLPQLISYWSIPPIILGKLYSNAMMVNFNHRMEFANAHRIRPSDINIPSSLFATFQTQPSGVPTSEGRTCS
ncbi:hypothetical protein BDZ94DRAFT_1322042 [Collybia nuda]|uniref:DUF6534 domain-containing protein n=1 Tax=Collybia nuda TaxID=64659 RepID=A0A9P5Y6L1_9AGAR|nr:hypothetical protein BDZ94DRAFT_1322042 [Collybia nuda]